MPASRLLLALGLLTPTAASQNVLIVDDDGGPGTDHASLEVALAAAASGDILVIRDGTYVLPAFPPVEVSGRALTLVGQGHPEVRGTLDVRDLASDQTFVVRGLRSSTHTFSVRGFTNAGHLWIEDSDLGAAETPEGFTVPCFVQDTASLQLHRVTGLGARFELPRTPLHAWHSSLHAEKLAQTALRIQDADGYAAGSTFAGLAPGLGLRVIGNAEVRLLDSTVSDWSGTITFLPGTARSYRSLEGSVTEGEDFTLRAEGLPGDLVYVFGSTGAASIPDIGLSAPLVLRAPIAFGPVLLGTVPPSGVLDRVVTAPALPAGAEGQVTFSQAAVVTPGEGVLLAGASVLVILDAGP